jgi:hypothetical protein
LESQIIGLDEGNGSKLREAGEDLADLLSYNSQIYVAEVCNCFLLDGWVDSSLKEVLMTTTIENCIYSV